MVSSFYGRARLLTGAALIAAFALVGCGDGDDTTAAELTKAQYIKQADAICSKTEKRQQQLVGEFSKKEKKQTAGSEEALVRFAGIPPLATQAEELGELPVPKTGAKEAEAFLKAFEAGVEGSEKDPKSLLTASANPFAEAEKIAQNFGFKVCRGA
jgi:hypothetical protein